MLRILQLILPAGILLLAACTTTDSVVFVTKTSLGIDVDASAPGVSVAYDRVEGYFAPRYKNSGAPAVYADFGTNGNVFVDRKIKQVYATGRAATKVSTKKVDNPVRGISTESTGLHPSASTDSTSKHTGKTMFFGTSTVVGFKVGYSASAIESISLGYKRKEFSQIPRVGNPQDYPSTIAAFDNHTATVNKQDTSLAVRQFFATGEAANNLADLDQIRDGLQRQAETAIADYREEERQQTRSVLTSLTCLAKLDDTKLLTVWDHAEALQLFDDASVLVSIRASTPHDSRAIYTDNLRQYKAASPYHTALLRGHAERVCKLAMGG